MVNHLFKQWKEILSEYLSWYQSVYLANLNGTTHFVTKDAAKKEIEFYCDHEEADTKVFAYVQFFSNTVQLKRVIINSPDTEVPVISLYHYVTNLDLLTQSGSKFMDW